MDRYRCTICHAEHETLAGPAFADVAAKYAGDRLAVSKIARDIRSGVRSGAPWHMPPHPEVSPAVARTMARYIMSLSAGTPAPREAIPRLCNDDAWPRPESLACSLFRRWRPIAVD